MPERDSTTAFEALDTMDLPKVANEGTDVAEERAIVDPTPIAEAHPLDLNHFDYSAPSNGSIESEEAPAVFAQEVQEATGVTESTGFAFDASPSLFDFDEFIIRDAVPAAATTSSAPEVDLVSPFDLGADEAFARKDAGAPVMEWDLPLPAGGLQAETTDVDRTALESVDAVGSTASLPKEVAALDSENDGDGIKRHTLDQYLALEEALGIRKPVAAAPSEPPVPAHLRFEVKTVHTPAPAVEDFVAPTATPDPMEQRVEDAMQQMAADRRKSLRAFNHTFKNVQRSGAEEFAQAPAFQRAGVSVDHSLISQQNPLSGTSLNGEGDDLTFRTHNRFLHDNVD